LVLLMDTLKLSTQGISLKALSPDYFLDILRLIVVLKHKTLRFRA